MDVQKIWGMPLLYEVEAIAVIFYFLAQAAKCIPNQGHIHLKEFFLHGESYRSSNRCSFLSSLRTVGRCWSQKTQMEAKDG